MTVNYLSGGVDFDALFDPDVMGDGPAATGYNASGVPLKYAALRYGAKRSDVGYAVAGTDVSNLWAAKGTASYSIAGLQGKGMRAVDTALTNQPSVFAVVTVSLQDNGTWQATGATYSGEVAQPAPTSGTWLPAGAVVSDFEVQFVVAASGHSDHVVSNSAPAYASPSTPRSVALSLPQISANNGIEREATANVTIRLKRISTGVITVTTLPMYVFTRGWL